MELKKEEFDYFLKRFYKDLYLNITYKEFLVIVENYRSLFKEKFKEE